MASSQNDIANWALDLIGETAITDINDATEPAERLLKAWGPCRDAALRSRLWKFSIQRASLAADADSPVWGFARQYAIAADVVRVVQVDDYWPGLELSDYIASDGSVYHIEAGKILTDLAAPLRVRWAVNSVAVGLWDPCFCRVMACDLADRVSTRLTGSETLKARIKAERQEALREARLASALETAPVAFADNSWMASRFSA